MNEPKKEFVEGEDQLTEMEPFDTAAYIKAHQFPKNTARFGDPKIRKHRRQRNKMQKESRKKNRR